MSSSKALPLLLSLVVALGLGVAVPAYAGSGRSVVPGRPGPLSVSMVKQDGAVVNFGRSAGGRVKYQVVANGRTVATTRRTARVKVPLRCGRTYTVKAVAVDRHGRRSVPSPGARLRTRACLDTTAPTAPAALSVTAATDTSVTLAWPAATDDVGVSGYLVSRDGSVLGGATGTSYAAGNLRANTSYTFAVRARDKAGNLSAPVTVQASTSRPTPSTGTVSGYVLTTDDASFADAQRHYRQLGRVFPTFFSMTTGGDVTGTSRPGLTTWFQDRDIEVLPRFHTEDPAIIESIVADPARRTHAAQQIAQVVAVGGYDGANLDFEMVMPSTGVDGLTVAQRQERLRNGYSTLVEEVSALVHADGGLVSVAVSPNWCSATDAATRATTYCTDSASTSTRRPRAYLFDYPRLAGAADELWVMAWGLHWASSESGPVADARWLRAVTDYYADLFATRPDLVGRLTLGTNLYAMDWSEYLLRTDRLVWPGTAFPAAPRCPGTTRDARARTSYDGVPGAGTLVVDWTCITRFADTREFDQVDPTQFATQRFDEDSAENVLTAPDPSYAGAQRVLWYVDARTIERRAAIAADAGWGLGLWRLGREDQAVWSLSALTDGSLS